MAVLAGRRDLPRMRRRDDGWWLEIAGEPASPIDVEGDAVGARRRLLATDGVDRALIAHSPALGIEGLPPDEARALADAHAEGVAELGAAFGLWAVLPLADAGPAEVDRVLDAGAVGVCLPSGALATPAHVEALGPVLQRLAERDAPVFVHPGPDPAATPAGQDPGVPLWWPALAAYVPGMHVAWHAFAAAGRDAHPDLRVLWAMLAGLAPLHAERLVTRGGPANAARDANAFYDTSSYGAEAQRSMARAVGIEHLLHGSDRPVVAPPKAPGALGQPAWDALTRRNPARLLGSRAQVTPAAT